jgi:hypothetical protein
MTQTLKQRRRQNFSRKQKGGAFFDFLKNKVSIEEKVKGLFSGLKARFTKKSIFTKKVTPGQVTTEVKNMAADHETIFTGTRKRKQRKN